MPYYPTSHKIEQPILLTDADIPAKVSRSARFGVGWAHSPGRKTELQGDVHTPVMEDLILVQGKFRNRRNEDLFAVFDGHDGSTAARVAASRFHTIFEEQLERSSKVSDAALDQMMEDVEVYSKEQLEDKHRRVAVAMHRSFGKINEELKEELKEDGYGGTTALVTFFDDTDLYVANVGDTRAVLGKSYGKPERVSVDHRPIESERLRIEASGGKVYCASVPRVEGMLAVSRVLGDFDLERKGIIWHPHIRIVKNFKDCAQFLILASDGLWDLVSEQEAVNLVLDELSFSTSSSSGFGGKAKAWSRRYSRDGEAMMFDGEDDFFESKQTPSSDNNDADDEIDNECEAAASVELLKIAFENKAVDNISVIVVRFS